MPLRLLATVAVAFSISAALVPLFRRLSIRLGRVARPREDRWHRKPVALFGGVAIGCTLLLMAGALGVARELPALTIAAFVMFAVGLTDDIISLKPATKLIAQIACASVLLFFKYRLNWVESMTVDSLLTLVWVVGLTNAFNLLDNMDGLCAGTAIIVGAALLLDRNTAAGILGAPEARYLAALVGATGGFLVYNIHPATIFMGDSGSLLLGFSFGALTLSATRGAPTGSSVLPIVAAPVLVLLIPIFDTTLVTLSRMVSGRSASQGGRDHSSHRLVAIGLSERRAVALLWLLAALGGALSIAVRNTSSTWSVIAVGVFVISMVLFAAYLAGIRVYDDADARVRQGTFTPIVVEFMYKRRVAEVLLDFCLIALCYYAAYRMRFENPFEFFDNFGMFMSSLPLVLGAQLVAFFAVGVYRGAWRHFGMLDTLVVAKGVFVGVVTAHIGIFLIREVSGFFAYSRAVFIIYAVFLLVAVTLSRASFRLAGELIQRQRQSGRRVAIYGAGDAAGLVLRELVSRRGGDVRILGFIDDDPRKQGIRAMGYPVLGGYSALTVLVKAASVDSIVISATHMVPERLNNLEVLCSEYGVQLSRLRVGLEDLVSDGSADQPRSSAAPVVKFKQ